jgi:hypothetical protein
MTGISTERVNAAAQMKRVGVPRSLALVAAQAAPKLTSSETVTA